MRGFAKPLGSGFFSSSRVMGMRVAFSSPTSISMLMISSLGVQLFHLPDRTRVVGARLIEAIERGDLVVVRARQGILRLNYFDVVGHARAKAVARLVYFLIGKLDAQ